MELSLVLVVFKVLNLLPDLGEYGLADVFGILLIDAHADDETEDKAAVKSLELKPGLVVLGLFESGQQGDPRRVVVCFVHSSG